MSACVREQIIDLYKDGYNRQSNIKINALNISIYSLSESIR